MAARPVIRDNRSSSTNPMEAPLKTTMMIAGLAACLGFATTEAQAQFSERTIRVSNGINADHPVGNGVTKFNACLADKTGGKVKLQAFWGSALGDDLKATQSLRSGTLEMVITSTSPLVGIVPALGAFDLPFLFNNAQEADAVLDGAFGDYMSGLMPEVGLVNLSYWENGFRNLTNSRRAVTKPEDFAGIKVRVMQNNIFLDTFKTLGTNAVPMAFGEVFTALETRAIDGQENPVVTIDTSKFYEVQKYLSMTQHAYTPFMVLYSKKLWDELSADEQKVLKECSIVGRDEQRAASRSKSAESLKNVKADGMVVNEIAPEQIDRMREMVKPVYAKHAEQIGADVVSRLQAELATIRGKS